MGRARTLANMVIATCLGLFAIGTRAANDSVFATSRHGSSSRTGDVTPVAWPGGGRFLAAPMVAGTDVMGIGAVRIVNGVVTGTRSNFDDAPPEMSLQTFAFVDHGSSGFSAVFRFVHPIVQLHAWRRIDVRHTITVVLTDPDGAAHAVELQPDGTTAVGTMTAGVFTDAHEPGIAQHPKMLRRQWLAETDCFRQLTHEALVVAEAIEDRSPDRLRQHLERREHSISMP